jgi:Ca2+/Na+ antiporter
MLLGVLLLAVAAVALVAGSSLVGNGLGAAVGGRLPAAQIRSVAIGLTGALATTLVAVGRGQTAVGSGVPFGAAMFVLAAAFGAAALLARRPLEVVEPVLYAAPAAGIVLTALSVASDRAFSRAAGGLLALVFIPYLLWVLMEPGSESAAPEPDAGFLPSRPDGTQPAAAPATAAGGDTGAKDPAAAFPPTSSVGDAGADESTAFPAPGATATAPAAREENDGRRPGGPAAGALARAAAGVAIVVGAAFALVEGTIRVGSHAQLAPGFAGAAIAGSLTALPFALLVVFPRRPATGGDPGEGAMTVVAGLVTFVPGVAALVRPFELDGPSAVCLLAVAAMYAVAATWMLVRGRSDRAMGAVLLLGYAACLVVAGSL